MLDFQQEKWLLITCSPAKTIPIYLQKHSGVPGTEIATLKRAYFVKPLGGGWLSELLGIYIYIYICRFYMAHLYSLDQVHLMQQPSMKSSSSYIYLHSPVSYHIIYI